jgi:hypothetical protein
MSHDWFCSPLWWTGESPAKVGPIEEGELPIKPDLWERLIHWVEVMDRTFIRSDPKESGITDPAAREAWEQLGFDLWIELREQLGSGYHVKFFHEGHWLRPEDFPASGISDE